MGKKRYEQKNEEKITSLRERASAMKEKEKVCPPLVLVVCHF